LGDWASKPRDRSECLILRQSLASGERRSVSAGKQVLKG
jgi:hypothetical protein